MFCPRCNAPVNPEAPYCTNCNLNLASAQYAPNQETESKREKRYHTFLIVLAVFFVWDGIFWRIIDKLRETFGYEIYDYIDPYRWLTMPLYSSLPMVVGLMLPKTTPWRLILIIGGSVWLAYRLFEFIQQEINANDFVFFEF
jgi:hypothetical protein